MPRESACRNECGTMLHFDKNFKSETDKWIPLEPDGTPHQCPKSPYNLKNATSTVATAATQQIQKPQSQQPQNAQVTEAMSTLVTVLQELRNEQTKATDGLHRLANEYEHISRELVRLNDYYDGLVTAQKGTAAILSQYLDKNQRMADAEVQYDQDKEDGTVGSLGNGT